MNNELVIQRKEILIVRNKRAIARKKKSEFDIKSRFLSFFYSVAEKKQICLNLN